MAYKVNRFLPSPESDGAGSLSYRKSDAAGLTQHRTQHSTGHPADVDIKDSGGGDSIIHDWYRLFGSDENSVIQMDCVIPLQQLRQLVTDTMRKRLPLRSICWRLFLGVLPMDMSHWCITLARERQRYVEIDCMVNPDLQTWQVPEDHPLSQESYSPWNRHFRANRIKRTIAQDVDRTFPKVEYFRDPRVHKAMVNVLFCYCENYAYQYRQGMHEILAPLFFVLHHDYSSVHQIQTQQQNKSTDAQISSILNYCLRSAINPDYLEADAFSMFCVIMNTIQLWYISDENPQEEPNKFRLSSGQKVHRVRTNRNNNGGHVKTKFDSPSRSLERLFEPSGFLQPPKNPGIRYVDDVHHGLVRQLNEALHAHLERLDIFPALFGLRWIRLLFGHEYALPDLLIIWDCIFAIGENFALVRFLYASMLVLLAPKLLACNFSECLNLLMHYPVNTSSATAVQHILRMALHLCRPSSYPLPIESKSKQQHARTMPRERRTRASTLSSAFAWKSPKPARNSNSDETGNVVKTPSSATLTRRRISEAFSLSNIMLAASLDDPATTKRTAKKSLQGDETEIRSRSQEGDTNRLKLPGQSLTKEIAETLKQALNIRPNPSSTPTIPAPHSLSAKFWTGSIAELSDGRRTPGTENGSANEYDYIIHQLTLIQDCNLRRLTNHLHGCAIHIDTVLMNGMSQLENSNTDGTPGDTTTRDQNWQQLLQLKQAKAQLAEAQNVVDQVMILIDALKTSTTEDSNNATPIVHEQQHKLSRGVSRQAVSVLNQSQDPEAGDADQTSAHASNMPGIYCYTYAGCQEEDELERIRRLGKPGSALRMKRFPTVDYGEEADEQDHYSD